MNGTDILTEIKQTPTSTSDGPVGLPILYRDGSTLVIGYRVDPAIAMSILGGLPLEPFVMLGRALVLVCLFEYRDTTIGSYNEICIGIYVRRAGTAPSLWSVLYNQRKIEDMGMYVVNLPVSSRAALTAGVEIWGFPKYVTGIATSFQPDRIQVTLENEFVLTHSRGFGFEIQGIPIITYTFRNNRLLRTIVEVGHRMRFGGAHSIRLRINGDGPTAATAKALGLDAIRPTFAFRTEGWKAVLPEGKDIGAIAA
jgi:acetoacetate decarboxylase